MVASDVASAGLDLLELHAADLDALVLDLVDERLGVVPLTGGSFVTDSQELKESGVKNDLSPVVDDLELGTDEHLRRWRSAARAAIKRLDSAGLTGRTVVLRVPFASQTRDGHQVPQYMQRSAADWNDLYRPYYAFIEELGLPVVTLPAELALTDAGHRWGISPYHYVPEAYAWLMAEVRRAVAVGRGDGEAGQKTVRVPLSVPVVGIGDRATAGTIRAPLPLNVHIARWRLHVRGLDQRTDRIGTSDIEISGLWVGRQNQSGAFTSAPRRLMGRRRIPRGRRGLVDPLVRGTDRRWELDAVAGLVHDSGPPDDRQPR